MGKVVSDCPEARSLALKILLADDHPTLARGLARLMNASAPQWQIDIVSTAKEALLTILDNRHDAVLLDWHFDGEMSGVEVCRQAWAADSTVPIIMLTVADEVPQRVAAFEAGVNEYLVKNSISPEELCRRIEVAIHRCTSSPNSFLSTVVVDALTIELSTQDVFVYERLIHLPPHEHRVLLRLARSFGEPVAHAELCRVADITPGAGYKNLHNEISRMRERLGPAIASHIRTLRGRGYLLGKAGGSESSQE